MMRAISLLNFKGGIGKSTLAVNLGDALARAGQRVLLVDLCMQGNTSTGTLLSGLETPTVTHLLKREATIQAAIKKARNNLWVIPSDYELNTAATYITSRRQAYYTLRNDLQGYEREFDFVIFDHSPSYDAVTEAGLLASTEMIIPCELMPYAVQGLFIIFKKLEETLTDHTLINSGIVPMNVDMRYAMTSQYLAEMKEQFGELITPIVRTDALLPKSQSQHQTIFEYEQAVKERSRAARDFEQLATYFLKKEIVHA
jgi:chromosome partitioning protein